MENVFEDLLSFSTAKAVGKPIYSVLYQELPRALILSGIQVFSFFAGRQTELSLVAVQFYIILHACDLP